MNPSPGLRKLDYPECVKSNYFSTNETGSIQGFCSWLNHHIRYWILSKSKVARLVGEVSVGSEGYKT